MDQNVSRRSALKLAVSAMFLVFLPSCASNSEKRNPGPFLVDTKDVQDLNGLIAAIKKAGGSYLSSAPTVEDYYKAFAKSFVENARTASDIGLQVPKWIIDKLPNRKVSQEKEVASPVLITIAVLGFIFLVPLGLFYVIAFSSILTLTRYITEKLNEIRA